jgi:phosphoribosyl-AMP cyclohydrolase
MRYIPFSLARDTLSTRCSGYYSRPQSFRRRGSGSGANFEMVGMDVDNGSG